MKIVVCGGGIQGAAIAYYLAKKGQKCTIIEQTGIACAASGKAGGFLAKEWSDGTDLQQLSRESFNLHMGLMQEFTDCGYRQLTTLSVNVKEEARKKADVDVPDWVDGGVQHSSSLGTYTTTAQVHPYKLTNKFVEKARELVGTDVVIGKVSDLKLSQNKVTAVEVNSNEEIAADVIVIAMGPWTGKAKKWLLRNIPDITGHRAHSIVMKPENPVSPHALFVEYSGSTGHRSPEIYPRPDGTVYACGLSDDVKLPDDAADIHKNPESCRKIHQICGVVSSNLRKAEIVSEQACYLPMCSSGLPIIGQVPRINGAYVAAGHSCWGILAAPATGAALAELIIEGKSNIVDLSPFDPKKFID